MPNEEVHLSDQSGRVEASGFQAQLRRLDSLQTLMAQGGLVVGEVAQFLARAREEIEVLQREQQCYVETQQHVLEEKEQLLVRVDELEKAAVRAEVAVREREATISTLRAELQVQQRTLLEETRTLAKQSKGSQRDLEEAREKIVELERGLQGERELRERSVARARHERVALHTSEISVLKSRLSAVEQQLNAERDRRTRLMEVVKTHEVRVAAPIKQRELST